MTQLTRREFATRGFATLTLAAAFPFLAGCPAVTQTQLASLVAEVGAGLAEILPYLTSVSASAAAKIQAAFAALETAIQNWKPGSAIALIEQAVNDFVANMQLIPVIAEYQPLVAIIVATVEGLIALIAPGAAPVAGVSLHGRAVTVNGITIANPPTTASSFRSQWNKQVKGNAKLSGYALS